MFEDNKPSYQKRNSFTQMGAIGLQAPFPQARRQSFTQMGSSGLQALQVLSSVDHQKIQRNRAESFEQSTLVFQEQKKFYKPRTRLPQAKSQQKKGAFTGLAAQSSFNPLTDVIDETEDFYQPARGRIASEKIIFVEDNEQSDSTYLSDQEQSDPDESATSGYSKASPMPTPMPAPMQKPEETLDGKAPQMWLQLKSRNSGDGHYLARTMPLLPAIVEQNTFYKQHVGQCIFTAVESLLGLDSQMAPKVTGMLIELSIEEVRNFLQDYQVLAVRVKQASDLLVQQNYTEVHSVQQQIEVS